MKKTLYVHLDSSPLPKKMKDLIVLECNSLDDFCSFLGYELIVGLTTADGIPYYKVFQPGNLLIDFAGINKEVFALIVCKWESLLSELLHKHVAKEEIYRLKLPDEYTSWLLHHDDENFRVVGKKLLQKNSEVVLQGCGLYEEVIMGIWQRLKRSLHDNETVIDCIVFSNPIIELDSALIKDSKAILGDVSLLSLLQWKKKLADQKEQRILFLAGQRKMEQERRQKSDHNIRIKNHILSMKYIKGGTFRMGSLYGNETPIHSVTLSDFHITDYYVTECLWKAVMGNDHNSMTQNEAMLKDRMYCHCPALIPVQNISWFECQEFVGKLSNLTGKHFALPTEAQWEYVAIKKAFYFVSGVEWCNDWYGPYTSEDQNNPLGPSSGICKILRGFIPIICTQDSSRAYDFPHSCCRHGIGIKFRLVLLP